jgi:chemotaxis protein MotB
MWQLMKDVVDSVGDDVDIRVTYTRQGPRLSFDDGILFEFGGAELNPAGFFFLNRIADVIQKLPYPVRVEGHTDNMPIHTRRFPSNWELSTVRAVNVVKYFVEAGNVDPRRLSAVGYGDSKPLVSNDSPEHRAKNRRVEIVLLKEGEK